MAKTSSSRWLAPCGSVCLALVLIAASAEPAVKEVATPTQAKASQPKHHRARGYRTHSLAFGTDGAGEVISPPTQQEPFSALAVGAVIFITLWIACFAVSQFRAIAYDKQRTAEADRVGLVLPR